MKVINSIEEFKIGGYYLIEDKSVNDTYVGTVLEPTRDYKKLFVHMDGNGFIIDTMLPEDIAELVINELDEDEFISKIYESSIFRTIYKEYEEFKEFFLSDREKNLMKILKLDDEKLLTDEQQKMILNCDYFDIGIEMISSTKYSFTTDADRDKLTYLGRAIEGIASNLKSTFDETNFLKTVTILNDVSNYVQFSKEVSDAIKCSTYDDIKAYLLNTKFESTDFNFIDITKSDRMITYIPAGKKQWFLSDGNYEAKGRQSMKPHKFFGKLLADSEFAEYDIKCFVDEVISHEKYVINYVKGEAISNIYRNQTTSGWATSSCMKAKPLSYFDIYSENDAFTLGLIVDKASEEIVGRFLQVVAMKCDDDSEFIYNDRLYYLSEEVLAWYNAHCDETGIIRKSKNSADTAKEFYQAGKYFTASIKVPIKKGVTRYDSLPYMDTLGWGYMSEVANNEDCFPTYVSLWSTNGTIEKDYDEVHSEFVEGGSCVELGDGEHKGMRIHAKHAKFDFNKNTYVIKK